MECRLDCEYGHDREKQSERVQILRNAFQETLKDKEFLAELKKAKLSLSPVTGEDLQKAIANYFKQDPTLLAKLTDIIYK